MNWYNYNFEKAISNIHSQNELLEILDEKGINLIVLDEDFYKNKKVINIIKSISKIEKVFGNISILTLRDEFKFKHELLKNTDLKDVSSWNLTSGSIHKKENSSLIVTVSKNATQYFDVEPSREYKLSVQAKCYSQSAQFRLQINWLDKSNNFIETSLKPIDCEMNFKDYSMNVISPSNAKYGVIYATGHTETPVEFHMLSVKR